MNLYWKRMVEGPLGSDLSVGQRSTNHLLNRIIQKVYAFAYILYPLDWFLGVTIDLDYLILSYNF